MKKKILIKIISIFLFFIILHSFIFFSSGRGEDFLVVLDPGHGGPDSGAYYGGYAEKIPNLDIGLKTRNILQASGFRVLMTRETDIDVNNPEQDHNGDGVIDDYDELQARCDVANNNSADVFVSIHNNAAYNEYSNGLETYYAPDDSEGAMLAQMIDEEILKRTGRNDRGVVEANFYVIRNTIMPGCLVEGAFMSNPTELALLKTDEFREKIAQGISEGIRRFLSIRLPRLYGLSRYDTAIAISKKGWSDKSSAVILARGDDFPDALAGAPLAAKLKAPILLTHSSFLTEATEKEIIRLSPQEVFMLGSNNAISWQTEMDLTTKCSIPSSKIHRLGGDDRYQTALLIVKYLKEASFISDTAIIATGENFPDALSASNISSYLHMPIILTQQDYLPDIVKNNLKELGIKKTIIVGGTLAVSETISLWLQENGFSPMRINGQNRYETARKIADYTTESKTKPENILIATGENFPDALSAGPYAANKGSTLVLLSKYNELPQDTADFLNLHKSEIKSIYLAGGTGALSLDVEVKISEIIYD